MTIDGIAPDVATSILPQPQRLRVEEQDGQDSRKVAEQFTSILMGMLVKEMWKSVSVDGDGPFGSGPGAEVYRGMAEAAFADALATNGMKPLTDEVHRHILRLRERAQEQEPVQEDGS